MIPIAGQPILTAAETRAAEERAIAGGASVDSLMAQAGAGIAEAARRLGFGAEVLVLCGPGNNGGDGYVAASVLRDAGVSVRVAALGEPRSPAAVRARTRWSAAVEPLEAATPAPVLVDALFGTGLARPIEGTVLRQLAALVQRARMAIAVDLPSGIDADAATVPDGLPQFDLTLALGVVKPAHVLYPSAAICGAVRLVNIGLAPLSDDFVLTRPHLAAPDAQSHKYSHGMVAVVAGAMPGAAALCAEAAMRAGAGYALLLTDTPAATPHAVVHRAWSTTALSDPRIDVVVIGPGLGRDDAARAKLAAAIASPHRLVIDGDALHLLEESHFEQFATREELVVLTPHAGEFAALFGEWNGSKIEAARRAAKRADAFVVFKGPDTVIAAPHDDVLISSGASPWLSTAGTGDVLAGTIAASFASSGMAIYKIGAGVWMHGEAARRLGPAFIADDLVRELTAVRASL